MPDLTDILERLGLQHYYSILRDHGFETWETVLDIAEDDLQQLGFKLGHRRALQREIATFRGIPKSLSLEPEPARSSLSASPEQPPSPQPSGRTREGKRRYRRHPRPDSNAPKKPKTAYVNFADHLRTHPDISTLSFVDIAKEVGRQWQNLSPETKRKWESEAARATQAYEAQMDEYKKTDLYCNYQAYLEDFSTQQARATTRKRGGGGRVASHRPLETYHESPSSSSDSPVSLPSSQCSDAGQWSNALALVLSDSVSVRGEEPAAGTHARNLPLEDAMRGAMYAFITSTGSLPEMWSYDQADELLDRLYRPVTDPDPITIAECFIVAAMGACYSLDHFADRVQQALYVYSTLQFEENVAKMDYMAQVMYLGAPILLYKRFLVAATQAQLGKDDPRWALDAPLEERLKYREECARAAQLMMKTLGHLILDKTLPKRCWVVIYWSFRACIVLLLSAVSKMLDGTQDSIEGDLTFAKGCLDNLQQCCAYEPIARKYLTTLLPIYQSLRNVHSCNVAKTKTSIFSLLHATDPTQLSPPIPVCKAEVRKFVEQLSSLLMDPFGRKPCLEGEKTRRILSPDGSHTVFWSR